MAQERDKSSTAPPGASGQRRQPPSGRWSTAEIIVAATTVGLVILLTFPAYAVANRERPIILGMPLSMFWMVAWIVVEFIVLLAVYRWEHGRRRR